MTLTDLHRRRAKLEQVCDEVADLITQAKEGEDSRARSQTLATLSVGLLICDYIEHFAPPQDDL